MIKKLSNWIVGSSEEYAKIEPNYYGRNNQVVVEKAILRNKRNFKDIALVVLLVIIFALAKSLMGSSGLIYQDHKLVGFHRGDISKVQSFEIKGKVDNISKDYTVSFRPKTKGKEIKSTKDDDYYMKQAINVIEGSKDEYVYLPKILENGKKVTWKKQINFAPIYLILLVALLVALLRQSRYYSLKKFKKESQEDILNNLPGYINRLLVLYRSGKTLDEALLEAHSESLKGGFFQDEMERIRKNCQDNREDFLVALNRFAMATEVREFKRFTNLLLENRNRGSELTFKLDAERQEMWDKRRSRAIEAGKRAETKMVIPMTIVLLALIMITAAPAFLQM